MGSILLNLVVNSVVTNNLLVIVVLESGCRIQESSDRIASMKRMLSLLVPLVLFLGCETVKNVHRDQSVLSKNLADNTVTSIPDRVVVLTFDDGNISDLTTAAPILKGHGFGATFYITSGWVGKPGRLNWEQVKELNDQGFEIGNHSASHPNMLHISEDDIREQIISFDEACAEHGIPKATSFAYPGGHHDRRMVKALAAEGYLTARRAVSPEYPLYDRGGPGPLYNPSEDDPFLIPGAYVRGNLSPSDQEFEEVLSGARDGSICVLIYHGVPDVHHHCSTSVDLFTKDMQHLKDNDFTVISVQDLSKYIDVTKRLKDIYEPLLARLGISPNALKCDALGDSPVFSWEIKTTRPQGQSAYQILVASSEKNLDSNEGDLWNSGKVVSNQSSEIPYAGKSLTQVERLHWKVRCWNDPDEAEIKRVSRWSAKEILEEMGKIRVSDYSSVASFIGK
ncbi:MAG TPA: polysaccharide deacetylase family protein [Verrucomicrobia bacterium]|nr:polysaccharide deacetylase family protein [Verrucomicrobiota bacterium]